MNLDYDTAWIIYNPVEARIKQKIKEKGVPLCDWNIRINFGIKTGFNDAFIITTEQKNALIAEDPKSAEIIRPILRGRDIQRFAYNYANLWVINVHNGIKELGIPPIDIDDYPAIKAHLDQFYPKLAIRADRGVTPYNLRNCAYLNDLSMQKIVWGEISDKPKFAIDINGEYIPEATTFMMTGDHLKYLLCILNSTFSEYYFAKIGTTTGMGTLRWKKYLIETLPIPKTSEKDIYECEHMLDLILESSENDRALYIHMLNETIYSMLGFTDEEIAAIEEIVAQGAH